jgi:hypothetical protein
MGRLKNTIIISASSLCMLCTSVQSQEKGTFPVGTFELTPTLNVSLNKDSNIARSNINKIDSWITVINPEFILGKQVGENKLFVGVNASKGIYHSSEADDYDDYQFFADGEFEVDRRNRVTGSLKHTSGHDDRGTAYSIGAGNLIDGPDKYTKNTFGAIYSYGAMTALANVDVNLLLLDINYDVDVSVVTPTRLRDRKEKKLGSIFYYGVSPSTDLLVDVSYALTDYAGNISNVASIDSRTKSLLVGAKWETTASSSGFVKVGYQKRDFDVASRAGFSGLKWDAGVSWNPTERAIFEFSTASDTRETNGQGNFIRRKDYVANWRHEWLERFSSDVTLNYSDDSYEGGTVPRNDKIHEFRVVADYQFKRWLTLIMKVSYFDRDSDSTIDNFDYNRSLFSFTAQISL